MNIRTSDYCPYCRRYTQGIKDYETKEYLCKRCGRISKLNVVETMGVNTTPKKMKNSFLRWFRKRVI